MKQWQHDQLQILLTIDSKKKVVNQLTKIANSLGFDYCAYGLRSLTPVSRQRVVMYNNYPIAWQARYQENNYLTVDPTVQRCARTSLPIIWSDDLFTKTRELWEEARSFGLRVGWAQSIHDANGYIGMLTLARSGEPLSEKEIKDKYQDFHWLTLIAHIGISSHIITKLTPDNESLLTGREVETLQWTSDGKTSCEISQILGISERTVNFHINNAVEKLAVTNKLAAAVKASVLGMLY